MERESGIVASRGIRGTNHRHYDSVLKAIIGINVDFSCQHEYETKLVSSQLSIQGDLEQGRGGKLSSGML